MGGVDTDRLHPHNTSRSFTDTIVPPWPFTVARNTGTSATSPTRKGKTRWSFMHCHPFPISHSMCRVSNSATEWYQSYKTLRHLLNPIHFAAQRSGVRSWNRQTVNFPIDFPSRDDCRILILGCGNAKMGEDMRRGK